jgi:hypothetical protein
VKSQVVRLIGSGTGLGGSRLRIHALTICTSLIFIRAPALPSVLFPAIDE